MQTALAKCTAKLAAGFAKVDKNCAPGCSVLDCSCTEEIQSYRTTSPYYPPFGNPHITAWIVTFNGAATSFNWLKTTPDSVRAVRGGL